ncbi:MAG: DUF2911 domain-containing protein [Gemmatimonadota bacterium]
MGRLSKRTVGRTAPLVPALLIVLLLRAADGGKASQQVPLSQPGTVSQRIAGVDVRIVYNRPVARGRKLFGGIVPFGEVWNPGADKATRIELDGELLVGGRQLPAGKYSVWMVPEPERWTVIFSRAWDVYHVPYPEGDDALRLTLLPEPGPHMETLAFYFPLVDRRRAVLRFHWGETMLNLPVEAPA